MVKYKKYFLFLNMSEILWITPRDRNINWKLWIPKGLEEFWPYLNGVQRSKDSLDACKVDLLQTSFNGLKSLSQELLCDWINIPSRYQVELKDLLSKNWISESDITQVSFHLWKLPQYYINLFLNNISKISQYSEKYGISIWELAKSFSYWINKLNSLDLSMFSHLQEKINDNIVYFIHMFIEFQKLWFEKLSFEDVLWLTYIESWFQNVSWNTWKWIFQITSTVTDSMKTRPELYHQTWLNWVLHANNIWINAIWSQNTKRDPYNNISLWLLYLRMFEDSLPEKIKTPRFTKEDEEEIVRVVNQKLSNKWVTISKKEVESSFLNIQQNPNFPSKFSILQSYNWTKAKRNYAISILCVWEILSSQKTNKNQNNNLINT